MTVVEGPSIQDIHALRDRLGDRIVRTPLVHCPALENFVGNSMAIYGKFEFLQHTGTFKARGALAVVTALTAAQREAGVTAVSAGNHAIATAFAAHAVGTSAKIVMIDTANPARVEACRHYGAEIVFTNDIHEAFSIADRIQREEGRFLVHPFEGAEIATGTGMVGVEVCEQCHDVDAVIVPVGGGGLLAGIANAVKRLRPEAEVIGVEPDGADSMHRSFEAGEPRSIDRVETIADSLGAPFAMPYSLELCRANVDRLVRIDDMQLRQAMGILFTAAKIAVEPACAAATAALLGPLRDAMRDKKVVLIFCGSNIDWATFESQAIFQDQ